MSWVKLDPVQLGEWLGEFSSSRERGDWVFGFQAGSLGAMLRPGASKPEAHGHEKGSQLRREAKEDKERLREKKSDAGKIGNAKRWGNRTPVANGSQCDDFATPELVAQVSPGEERRGEEILPRGVKGDPSPMPEWKAAKVTAKRRQIEDLLPEVERLEAIPTGSITKYAREKLAANRLLIRNLETEILNMGVLA